MSALDTFPKLLLDRAERQPDRVAIRRKRLGIWQTYTWRRYAEEVRNLALGLRALGIQPEDRVGILAENRPEWLVAELAVQSLGALPFGIYADTPPGPMQELIDGAEARVLVAGDQQQVDKVLEVRSGLSKLEAVVYIDPKGMRHYEHPDLLSFAEVQGRGQEVAVNEPGLFADLARDVDGSRAGLLLITSGTSGLPKLVLHANQSFILAARAWNHLDPRGPADEHVSFLPLPWVGEQVAIALALHVGMPVNFPEAPETTLADLREISPTRMVGPPHVWERIASRVLFRAMESTFLKRRAFNLCLSVGNRVADLEAAGRAVPLWLRVAQTVTQALVFRAVRDKEGLKRVRHAYTGGAALGKEYSRLFAGLGIRLKQVYGLTETGGFLTCHRDGDLRPDTVGVPLEGVELKIAESGEILARTPTLMLGYYKNPEATAAAFRNGWLATADIGSLAPDGHLTVADRLGDVSQLADTTRFSPLLMESKLKFSPYVQECVVCGRGQAFLAALVSIDGEWTGKWAERRRLSFTSYLDLAQKPETYDLLQGEVERVNQEVAEPLRIRRFLLLPKEFDADDEELTRTRKVRRRFVIERYKELVEALFKGSEAVECAIGFRYEDGSQQVLKILVKIREVG